MALPQEMIEHLREIEFKKLQARFNIIKVGDVFNLEYRNNKNKIVSIGYKSAGKIILSPIKDPKRFLELIFEKKILLNEDGTWTNATNKK